MNESRSQRDTFRPDITVACVIERDGRYLLVQERVRGAAVINQPAGHLEPDESLLDAAIRETLEETRWEVRLTGLVGIYQWQAPDDVHFLRFAFAGEALREHAGRPLDDGIIAPLWLGYEELLARRDELRSPLVLRAIDDARSRPLLPLDALCWMP